MALWAFVFSCIVAGSLACNTVCRHQELYSDLQQVGFFPSEEGLRAFCPRVSAFLECEKGSMECSGQSLEQLTTSSDKFKAAQAAAMISGKDLLLELCDEDSSLHRDYVAHVNCSRQYFNGDVSKCDEFIRQPIKDFFEQTQPLAEGESMTDKMHLENFCLNGAYQYACAIENFGVACGDVAQRRALEGLEKMKSVLGLRGCKALDNAADLKSRFLNFLEVDEQKRRSLKRVFDLF